MSTATGAGTSSSDPELDHAFQWFLHQGDPLTLIGTALRQAYDEIIDTARTGRWDFEDCHTQEKAYLGVKVEHVIRGAYGLPSGNHGMDYDVDGVDVDCKWSKSYGGWEIPREAVGHICLLAWADEATNQIAAGLLRIDDAYLGARNQDKKRKILKTGPGLPLVRWLIEPSPGLPPNFLLHLPEEDRQAILGASSGDARAIELFIRCEGLIIQRHTIESIGQQVDAARRARATRPALEARGLELFNGHWQRDKALAAALGGPVPANSEEWVCLRSDGSTAARSAARLASGGGL